LLPFIHRDGLAGNLGLFFIMLVASTIRMVSDIINYGLYSRGQDKAFAVTNIFGFLIAPCLTFVLLEAFGLSGVGLSMLIVAISLFCLRMNFLLSFDRRVTSENLHVTR
jgi:O-antigen/teichoic acid export membrane protein